MSNFQRPMGFVSLPQPEQDHSSVEMDQGKQRRGNRFSAGSMLEAFAPIEDAASLNGELIVGQFVGKGRDDIDRRREDGGCCLCG